MPNQKVLVTDYRPLLRSQQHVCKSEKGRYNLLFAVLTLTIWGTDPEKPLINLASSSFMVTKATKALAAADRTADVSCSKHFSNRDLIPWR